jgi:hypothetical protein
MHLPCYVRFASCTNAPNTPNMARTTPNTPEHAINSGNKLFLFSFNYKIIRFRVFILNNVYLVGVVFFFCRLFY